ncbi:M28 family peptidase [Alkalinema sp. FACHB-956]|uniref:M28 family peptidase n=1 Tax=Alkalinema sp. FACHB-956 TaxID=2692768 RepID=UPI001685360B|nr:M28 family peptidase [Alkalinema sp. FACHB-956]MBD2329934.1 M28 family peptidase [Alkalinema sp. FACHB-956]
MQDLQQRLLNHLLEIVRERDPYLAPQGHFYVQQYVKSQLAQWGTVETHEFTFNVRQHRNLILNLPDRTGKFNRPPILIGAHYDGVPGSPGADDNASGVAVLLELARLFAEQPARYPIQLIAFDVEEYGLVGSRDYADTLLQQRQKIRLMLSLEMLGYCKQERGTQQYPQPLQKFYPDRGNFIGLIGNIPTLFDMLWLKQALQAAGVPTQWLPAGWKGHIVRATRASDHAPFWDNNYRAIMVTDTAFMRNPHYHLPSDRLETLDLQFMTHICQGLAQGLQKLY